MMSLVAIAQRLPQEIQMPMLEFAEVIEQNMRDQLAVRREDFIELQTSVQELTEAQKRTEIRLERTENRLDRVEAILAELVEAQKRTEQRVNELAEAQKRTEQRVNELAEAQKRTELSLQKLIDRVASNSGKLLEIEYRDKAYAYFGSLLRRVKVVPLVELESDLEERLSDAEIVDLAPLDLLVRGRVRNREGEVWLAVEVSAVVDANDVRRASRRAALLRKAGYAAVAVAAGEQLTDGALQEAHETPTLLVQDGRRQNWEEALALALPLVRASD